MVRGAIGRISSVVVVVGGWLVAGIRFALDIVGYSTVPEDIEVARTRLDQFLSYLVSMPWWAPLGFALAATLWLIWVSWPRNSKVVVQPTPIDPYAAAADLIKQLRLQDKQNQLREGLRGPPQASKGCGVDGLGDLILLHIEGTAVLHEMGFQSDAEYSLWARRFSQWNRDVNNVLSKYFPKEDVDWFSTLGVFHAGNCPNPYNDDHDHKYRVHWERLRRVGLIINKHQHG